jgi:hypothetical protein
VKPSYLLFAILFFTLILRIPSFFEPYWYGDEGIRLAVAQNWFSGGTLYKDIFDNAPPLLYLLFGAGKTLLGIKILAAIWILAATFTIFPLAREIARRFSKDSLLYPLVATSLFALFTSTPLFEGNIAGGEIFFILPTIFGMYLIFEKQKEKNAQGFFFLAGLFFSLASLIKIPSLTDFFAALILLGAFPKFSLENLKKKVWPTLLGFIIPWFITFVVFFFWGNFWQFWFSVFGYNFSYVNFANHLIIPQGFLILKLTLALSLTFLIWKKRKLLGQERSFIFLWLTFSLLGAFLTGRGYPHYLLQAAAPLSLTLPFFLMTFSPFQFVSSLALVIFVVLLFSLGNFPRQRVFSYYQNFLAYVLGQKDETSYLAWFDRKTPRLYTLASLIQTKTKPWECVFVYGDLPNFYPLAQRCPATLVVAAYHLEFGPDMKRRVIEQLTALPPPYIITIKNTPATFDELFPFLKANYRIWLTLEDASIWQKIS